MKSLAFKLGSLLGLAIMYFVAVSAISSPSAVALSGSDFNSGRIMDDAVFFNPNTMNPGDIQNFLNSKVPVCDTNGTQMHSSGTTRAAYGTSKGYPPPYICLKDFSQAIPSKAADAYCSGSISGGTKSAAQIIYDVSHACGINPKVLIVLLQKEQSLVTDDWPWSIQYRSATGYGCPDSAPCDSEYYGFFNQVYNAARQFQRYAKQADMFNYRGGQTSYVQYNPNAGCGGGNIYMQNQTTAGLYNYTPYQPNAAALANLYGTGDGCSAYGNRNFWRMFIDWFGSPYSNVPYAWMYEGQFAYSNSSRTQPFTLRPTVTPGTTFYVRIKARNMGTRTWSQSNTNIGTSHPTDRSSVFADSSWISGGRPARLLESTIAPGQIGTFEFAMKAPNTVGTYKEYFNPLIENVTWLNDLGLNFSINVTNATTASSTNHQLLAGQALQAGQYLLSQDRQTTLGLQNSGSLSLITNFKTNWSFQQSNSPGSKLVMQGDGNLVLYNKNMAPLWNTETSGNPGARLVLQTDGNMVVYGTSGAALWNSSTISNPNNLYYVNYTLSKSLLYPGQALSTADRNVRLILQGDGNLVLYKGSVPLWATGTDGKQVSFLAMQGDGNLVLYSKNMTPLWYSHTSGYGNLYLTVQGDGNLVIYNTAGKPYWHTGTYSR